MYHYSKRVDYQSIARKAMLNNDTMILFWRKHLRVRERTPYIGLRFYERKMKICILANFSYSNTLYIKYFSYICTIKQNQGRKSNAKAYIIDPGLQNNRDNSFAGENIGWRLENVVYIELLRRCANEYLKLGGGVDPSVIRHRQQEDVRQGGKCLAESIRRPQMRPSIPDSLLTDKGHRDRRQVHPHLLCHRLASERGDGVKISSIYHT